MFPILLSSLHWYKDSLLSESKQCIFQRMLVEIGWKILSMHARLLLMDSQHVFGNRFTMLFFIISIASNKYLIGILKKFHFSYWFWWFFPHTPQKKVIFHYKVTTIWDEEILSCAESNCDTNANLWKSFQFLENCQTKQVTESTVFPS